MSTKPQELNKIIADLRQIIVGKVAMPTDQIEQITLFLFLKQLSQKHDELVRIGSKDLIFTGDWERYHFDVLMRHSGEDLVKECREAVESLYKNPHIDPTVRKVFERSYLKILEPKVLSSFLIYLNDKFSDGLDLGDFYESLLPILGTQNELGQFRTPRHIIDFIVRVVDPSIGEKIADPACGTAGFLVSAFNYLKEKYTEKGRLTLNPEQTKQLYNDTIYGWDMEPLMVKFSLANLYLHGLKVPNVSENDTLLNENLWQHTFDIIVANPPFITPKGGAKRHSRFSIISNKTEVLFCEWMVHHLNFNGRMGIIVPEGIIFDASKGHHAVRKLFIDNGLWCVVSLPQRVFNPYSPVKTSIIFLDKTLKPEQILFHEIENHGFSLNTNPTPINKNDLPSALRTIGDYRKNIQNGKQISINETNHYTISKQRILETDTLNLLGGTYRASNNKVHDKWPMVELGEVLDYEQPTRYIVSSEDYSDKYKIPVLTAGKTFILGYTNENTGICDSDLPLIIFDDFTTATKLVDFPFKVKSSAMKILHAKKERANIKFLFYMMQNIDFSSNTHKRYWISQYSKINIPLPPLETQEQIVKELERYQKIIDGARQIVENWKPNFEIDQKWGMVELSKLVDLQNGYAFKSQDYVEKSNTLNFRMSNIRPDASVDINYNPKYLPDTYYEKFKDFALFEGDVVIAMTDMAGEPKILGVPTIIHSKGKHLLMNQRVGKFNKIDTNRLLISYLKYALQRDEVKEYYKKLGGGGVQINIGKNHILSIYIPLPPLVMQEQIVKGIEEEQKTIEANRQMLNVFENKIKARIKSTWGS
jgi:type I restriction enzyme M protein